MIFPKSVWSGLVACCLLVAACGVGNAQMHAAKPAVGTQVAPAQVFGQVLSGWEREFVSLAEAMPEDKYNFAPTQGEFKGVRTFAEQVKHVAESNDQYFADPTKPRTDKSAAIAKLKTKAEIVAALKDSFAEAHAYVNAMTPENAFVMTAHGTRAGTAAFAIAHMMDHYGQMVEYLRMNGIIPPASRGRM